MVLALLFATTSLFAQTNAAELALQEKEACIKNLKTIYTAVQAYQLKHKDLPNWLSDLVPDYLPDNNVLICPVCRRTGRIEDPPLADPNITSSYLFEFCPLSIGNMVPGAAHRTRRDWKRRQMGVVGSAVPIIRCRHHSPALNVSFDGNVYESPGQWELAFTNRVNLADLSAAALFADEAGEARPPTKYPPRDPKSKPANIDLGKFFNGGLSDAVHGQANVTLGTVPKGLRGFGGVEFEVRGLVQLSSQTATNKAYAQSVRGIPVRQKAKRLHLLHGASFGKPGDEGKQIASLVVRFAGNDARLEIPIQYGRDVRNYLGEQTEAPGAKPLTLAWSGTNASGGTKLFRLYRTTWTNIAPDAEIESVDYVSGMAGPAPFLIGITAEN